MVQGFLIAAGALWLFWKAEAPEFLLYLVAGLGGLYIVFEKVRATLRPKPNGPPAK